MLLRYASVATRVLMHAFLLSMASSSHLWSISNCIRVAMAFVSSTDDCFWPISSSKLDHTFCLNQSFDAQNSFPRIRLVSKDQTECDSSQQV